jgi:hypothetical protein
MLTPSNETNGWVSVVYTTLSKKYPTLGQEKKSFVPGGGSQFLIPFKVGPL